MNTEQKFSIGYMLILLIGIGGFFTLCVTTYFGLYWLIDTENALRHEYLIGAALGLLGSAALWTLAAVMTFLMRNVISNKLSVLIYSIFSVTALMTLWAAFIQPFMSRVLKS